jgi:serine/threonine-protein kinase RIO1
VRESRQYNKFSSLELLLRFSGKYVDVVKFSSSVSCAIFKLKKSEGKIARYYDGDEMFIAYQERNKKHIEKLIRRKEYKVILADDKDKITYDEDNE